MIRIAETSAIAVLLAAASCGLALGQVTQPLIFIDVENGVNYNSNITDQPKLVPNAGITPSAPNDLQGVFPFSIFIGDIVAVNGQPAKGTLVYRAQILNLVPADAPREANAPAVVAVADTMRAALQTMLLEILKPDGAPIGIFTLIGTGGTPPVGSPAIITNFNFTIVGGNGAFLGARGQGGLTAMPAGKTGPRSASMAESPANRRTNGGGFRRYALQVIPHTMPQVAAVLHADFTPVTAALAAMAGEVLIMQATGLGPTIPKTEPGQAFPLTATQEVNSPVEVSVNGKPAEVLNKIGWPGLMDTYRVDFRVPGGIAAGTAGVQLTAAWIVGPQASIAIK